MITVPYKGMKTILDPCHHDATNYVHGHAVTCKAN